MVALDGSTQGDSALPHARALARALGSDIHLVTVLDPSLTGGTWGTSRECRLQRIEAMARLDRIAAAVRSAGVEATSEVREGHPPDEIVAAAVERGAALVAIAARPRIEDEPLVSRGVAQSVIASGRLSLLVARGDRRLPTTGNGGPYRRIAVGVDGSRASHRALQLAVGLAESRGAELLVVHAPRRPATGTDGDDPERYLHRIRRTIPAPDVRLRLVPRSGSDAAETLQSVAEEEAADLIVVGAHGAGESGCRYGSCARTLLLRSKVPVLLVQDRDVAQGDDLARPPDGAASRRGGRPRRRPEGARVPLDREGRR